MKSSPTVSNPITKDTYKRIKKSTRQTRSDVSRLWRSKTREKAYKLKLLQALQHVRRGSRDSGGRAVHEAADRLLAMTAKGRSRWSRAILSNKSIKRNLRRRGMIRDIRLKKLPTVQRKARDLSRLVPGCRKQSLPIVLEEVADYVSALNMQVRVMAAVADLLSDRSSSGSGFVAGAVNVPRL